MLSLTRLATYATGAFGEVATEIVAHDPGTRHLFVVNAQTATLAVLDVSDPAAPVALDVTDPAAPTFVDYASNGDFEAEVESAAAGDLGFEGLLFIPVDESPNGRPCWSWPTR